MSVRPRIEAFQKMLISPWFMNLEMFGFAAILALCIAAVVFNLALPSFVMTIAVVFWFVWLALCIYSSVLWARWHMKG